MLMYMPKIRIADMKFSVMIQIEIYTSPPMIFNVEIFK